MLLRYHLSILHSFYTRRLRCVTIPYVLYLMIKLLVINEFRFRFSQLIKHWLCYIPCKNFEHSLNSNYFMAPVYDFFYKSFYTSCIWLSSSAWCCSFYLFALSGFALICSDYNGASGFFNLFGVFLVVVMQFQNVFH